MKNNFIFCIYYYLCSLVDHTKLNCALVVVITNELFSELFNMKHIYSLFYYCEYFLLFTVRWISCIRIMVIKTFKNMHTYCNLNVFLSLFGQTFVLTVDIDHL